MQLKKRFFVSLFFFIVVHQALAAAPAGEASQEDPKIALIRALEGLNSFQANFVQKIKDANGQAMQDSKGQIMVSRPGKFYWKSETPDPIVVVGDGQFLWTYDIDLAQVNKQDQHKVLGQSPAAILAGSVKEITSHFKISYAPKNLCQANQQCYLLNPLGTDAQFSNILLGFSQGELKSIRMEDPLGQVVTTRFTQVKVNQNIDAQRFRFTPPKGVDVIQGGRHD